MPNIFATSKRTGRTYSVNIAGTSPTPEEQNYIEQRIDNIEGVGVARQPAVTQEPEKEDVGLISGFASGLGRGFATSFTEAPKGIVGLGESLLGYEPGSTAIGEAAQDLSESGREGVEYVFGKSEGTGQEKFGEAFGSLASFLVPGTVAAKGAKLAGASVKGQQVAGVAGAGGLGVGLGASEQINRVASALSQGKEVSAEDFMTATKLGGAIGASEALPFTRLMGDVLSILRKVPKQNQDQAVRTIVGRLKRAVGTGTAEGLQEAGAGIAQDFVERGFVDAEATIGGTVGEEFLFGGSAGATLQFIVDSIRGKQLNKMDKKFTQLQEDLNEEAQDSAEKAKYARESLNSSNVLEGERKLISGPTEKEQAEEETEVPDTFSQRMKDLGLSPQEETQLTISAAKERQLGDPVVPLTDLPVDEAGLIRASRVRLGKNIDQYATMQEIESVVGVTARNREYAKRRPNLWRESNSNPKNTRIFSNKQLQIVRDAVREKNNATVPFIQKVLRDNDGKAQVSLVRAIQKQLQKEGVLVSAKEGKYAVKKEPEAKKDPVQPTRDRLNSIETRISEAQELKVEAQARRDKFLDSDDSTNAKTVEQQINRIDKTIGDLNAERDKVDAELNQLNPQEPIVRNIDPDQSAANRARESAEQSPEKPLTDEYALKRKKVANALRKFLFNIGLSDRVDLVTNNVIFPENASKKAGMGDPDIIEGVIEGAESGGDNGKRIIALAMEIYDPNLSEAEYLARLQSVMNHEVIHSLRALGLFTDGEWSTLTKASKERNRVILRGGRLIERDYTYYDRAKEIYSSIDNYDEASIVEEAVAEMFRDFADGKLKVVGKPKNLFTRIIRFFTSIFKSHNEAGFNKVNDIFQNIITKDKSKQIGRRETGYGQIAVPLSNAKYSTAGIRAGFIVPEKGNIERIQQSFKDVTKRIPKLTDAAQKLSEGTISYDEYDSLVNEFKPIVPYETVPAPESYQSMYDAMEVQNKPVSDPRQNFQEKVRKQDLVGIANQTINDGDIVGVRLDIPSYKDSGTWTVSVHGGKELRYREGEDGTQIPTNLSAGSPLAYEAIAVVEGPVSFGMAEAGALKIAGGASKGTIATFQGRWRNTSSDDAFAFAQQMMNDPEVVQVGMDPERHSYFYDRTTTQPVIGADFVVQIGPLVLAKNPKFAPKNQFKYSIAPGYKKIKREPSTINDVLNLFSVKSTKELAKLTNFHRLDSNGEFVDFREYNSKGALVQNRLADALYLFNEERNAPALDPENPKDMRKIARLMAMEAAVALKRDPSAIGWYGTTIDKMFDFLSTVKAGNEMLYPELSIDPEARAAFRFTLAVTSNGLAVEENFISTSELYDTWKETGFFPVRGYGERIEAMEKAFSFYNELKRGSKDRSPMTDTEIERFLDQRTTVGALKNNPVIQELGIKISTTEAVNTEVSNAYILGAKIGNGFYSNLGGNFDALTMDIWWMRFWNRLTGNPFRTPTTKTLDKNNKRVVDALTANNKTDYEQKVLTQAMESIGVDLVTPDTAPQLAQEIDKIYQLDFGRVGSQNDKIIKKYMKDNNVSRGRARELSELIPTEEKTELFKASETYAMNLDPKKPQDTPRSATQRRQMREATAMARQILKEEANINITSADFQALMWYAEKQLLKNAGVQQGRGEDNDYLDGAIEVAKRKGFTDEQIAETLPNSDGYRVDSGASATGQDVRLGEQPNVINSEGSIRYSISPAKDATIRIRISAGNNGRIWSEQRGSRKDSQFSVKKEYNALPFAANIWNASGVNIPTIYELNANEQSSNQFYNAITSAKESQGDLGSSVFVYPESEYNDMRLFITSDGKAGFALKESENGISNILSVFNTNDFSNRGFGYTGTSLAVQQGGNKLEAFDTFLPGIYSANGFTVRSRIGFNEGEAPTDWNKESYKTFNNGEPDVVFMYYNSTRSNTYENGSGEGELFTDYAEAVASQEGAALSPQKSNRSNDYVSSGQPRNVKYSLSYLPTDMSKIQNQIPVAQNQIMYSRAFKFISKILGVIYPPTRAEDIAENFLIKFQDNMLPVGRMIDEIRSQGGTIVDANDTYLREELYHGITGSKVADNERDLYDPLIQLVKQLNVTDSQYESMKSKSAFVKEAELAGVPRKQIIADAFLYARHAKERNAYIRTIDESNNSGSGMSDSEADSLLAFFDGLPSDQRAKIQAIGNQTDKIIKNTNDIRLAGGLIPDFNDGQQAENADGGERVNSPQYSSYVPLRGLLDPNNDADDEFSGRVSSRPRYGARGREDIRAKGRYEYPRDIIANLLVQNQNAIIRAERNKVGQSFLKLIEDNPDLTREMARVVQKRPLVRVISNGTLKIKPDPNFRNREDVLIVKKDGQEIYIEIDDPRIAMAMRGSTGLSSQHIGGLTRFLGKVNRYFSNINTSYNPEFLITNMVRDLATAGVNINQYEMDGITSQAVKMVPKSLAGIYQSIVKKDNSSEFAKIYEEFVRAGGQNSTNQMSDLNDQISNLQSKLDDISSDAERGLFGKVKNGFLGQAGGSILQTLENYNTVVENGVRVATFKALIDRGFSKERAAQAARNVTVNFAKGGEYKTFMNSWYLFYNASIQGSFALANAALRSPRVRKLWIASMMFGLIQDQLLALGGEDEDGKRVYDKIPDYVLEKNIILPDVFGILESSGLSKRGYIKIPMPYGLNMTVNAGRAISRAGRGGYTPSEATATLVGTVLDVLNPIGDTPRLPFVEDAQIQDLLTTVSPTIVDPVAQVIINEDFARKPIYKEQSPFGIPRPESQLHWNNTSTAAKFVANQLRKPFGLGDASDVRPGFIEVSPDVLEFWFNYFTGGVGRFVLLSQETAVSTLPATIKGEFEESMISSVPLVRKVLGSVTEREDIGSFIEKRDRVLLARKDLIDARKNNDVSRIQSIMSAYGDEVRMSGTVNALNNTRNKLIRTRKKIISSESIPDSQKDVLIKRIDEKIELILNRANQVMAEL